MGEPIKKYLDGLAQAGKSLSYATARLLELRDQYGAANVLSAVVTAIKYQAFGVEYIENILHQSMRPRTPFPQVVLPDPILNQLQLQEPDLLIYDAITLKKRNEQNDPA